MVSAVASPFTTGPAGEQKIPGRRPLGLPSRAVNPLSRRGSSTPREMVRQQLIHGFTRSSSILVSLLGTIRPGLQGRVNLDADAD
jgi:hypothetical protein